MLSALLSQNYTGRIEKKHVEAYILVLIGIFGNTISKEQ